MKLLLLLLTLKKTMDHYKHLTTDRSYFIHNTKTLSLYILLIYKICFIIIIITIIMTIILNIFKKYN